MEQPLAVNGENSRAKVQNVGGDSSAECPKALQYFWSGHAQTHVSERYTKLLRKREYRLEWAEKIGMGFGLPERPVAHLGHLIMFRKTG